MSTGLKPDCTAEQTDCGLSFSIMYPTKTRFHKIEFCFTICVLEFLNYSTCLTEVQSVRVVLLFHTYNKNNIY